MTRILFVDDEPRVLSGLRRQCHSLRDTWDMEFADSAAVALELLDAGGADAVVTDLCMPTMDGAELLSRIIDCAPRTVRLALSGHADPARLRKARARAHRCLEKPCAPELLQSELRQALRVRDALDLPGHAVVARMWSTPPDRVPTAEPLLPLLYGTPEDGMALGVLEGMLGSEPRTACRLDAMLAPGLPDGALAAGVLAALGARAVAPLVMSLRIFETFFEPGIGWDAGLAGAQAAASSARAASRPPAGVAEAACAGLLTRPEGPQGPSEALAYLLPGWGLSQAVALEVSRGRPPADSGSTAFAPTADVAPAATKAPPHLSGPRCR